jgi:hypothetical protein
MDKVIFSDLLIVSLVQRKLMVDASPFCSLTIQEGTRVADE